MIDILLTQMAAGFLFPIIAYFLIKVISRSMVSQRRHLKVRFSDSNVQSVIVDSDASEGRIADRVREAFDFERQVLFALTAYVNSQQDARSHSGRRVDFVLEQGGRRVAVEAKLDTESLSKYQLERYLRSEDDLSALILVSPSPLPEGLAHSTKKLIDSGRVYFLAAVTPAELPKRLESSLVKALRLGVAIPSRKRA